jgi:two-component system phosphate regulon sensor histidine kinase PhoR
LKTIFRQRKEERIKRDFVDTLTHELRRPIASSIFMLDYLNDKVKEKDTSSLEEYLTASIFELKKLNLYIERIQEISKGEEAKMELTRDTVSLESFFIQLKEKYESLAEKKICIHLQIETGLHLITDVLHFSNIMENLTDNSIKYSGESVNITISASTQNDQIHIIHGDNGWGISKSEIPHIFDKFHRGKSGRKRIKNGFGLGLSYIRIMMKSMNGGITVNSRENEFTEFTLLFPLES